MKSLYEFLFGNPKMAWLWFVVRIYLGWEWLHAGYEKIINPVWVGATAGWGITGFVNGALMKTGGSHPDVSSWYAWFLQHVVLPYAHIWSHAIAFGEVLVGFGLIVGAFTVVAAFFGFLMNLNYLFSGSVSVNPQMLLLALLIMMAYRIAGLIGLDYFIKKFRKV
jgi:thiosulfate dehydrogenase [quinone] large subunit